MKKKLFSLKKRMLISAGLVLLTTTAAQAQTLVLDTNIAYTFDDWGMSIANTSDGGSVVVGGTYEIISGYGDALIMKFDANGDTTWAKRYGNGYWQRVYSVQQTSDGGYVATGNSWDDSQTDAYTLKLDMNGDLVWEKKYGGTAWQSTYSVKPTNDNSYIITGRTEGMGPGAMQGVPNVYLAKLDANGDTLWTKGIGGTAWDEGHEVLQTADNGYIIAGSTFSSGTGGDVYIVKTDANGAVQWEKNYGGNFWDEARHIQALAGGGYVVCGFKNATSDFNNSPINGDVYLLRTDANGDTLWTKTYGGINTEIAYVVRETSDGGFIIAGETESFGPAGKNGYVIRTDENGVEQWTQRIDGNLEDKIHDLVIDPEGNFLVTGWKYNPTDANVLMAKISDEGNTSGLMDMSKDQGNLFPNPAQGKIYIQSEAFLAQGNTLSIFNALGQNLMESKANASKGMIEIDISTLAAGIYYVNINENTAQNLRMSFVVNK